MAEFCLKCWNEINKTDDPASKYILSKELDLCEGCGKRTHVIVAQRDLLSTQTSICDFTF